jgi:hypothetical protein
MTLLSSLKRALTVNFLLVGAVPVFLFGMVSVQLVAEQQLNGVRERNIAQAQVIAEEIEIFLREVRTDLQMVREVIASGTTLQATHVNQFLTTVVHNS